MELGATLPTSEGVKKTRCQPSWCCQYISSSSATFLELLWMACTCQASPFICVSFTLFYIYSGWVIVAVMTGTVSFTMISFKERMVQDDDSREEELSENFFTCLDRVAIDENMQHFLETLRKHFRVLFISRRRGILWSSCLRISLKNWIPMEMETHLISWQFHYPRSSINNPQLWAGSAEVSWTTKSSKRCWNPRRSCCYFLNTLISIFKTWKILFSEEATAEYVKLNRGCQRDGDLYIGSCLFKMSLSELLAFFSQFGWNANGPNTCTWILGRFWQLKCDSFGILGTNRFWI